MPDTTPPTPANVVVATQSAWASKINWTQAIAGLSMLLSWYSGGKIGLTADQQLALVTSIGVIANLFTWVFKTWFTKTVTPASVTNASTTTTFTPSLPLVHIN